MACGCNTHLGYSTNGTKHPHGYPAHYGCVGHSGHRHSGHSRYPGSRWCSYHSHRYGCWGHAIGSRPLTRDAPMAPTNFGPRVKEGDQITASQHNSLITVISRELYRWHRDRTLVENLRVVPGDILTNERVKSLRGPLLSWRLPWTQDTAPYWYSNTLDDKKLEDGDAVTSEQINALRDRVHILQARCTCNCNYCTCNCNYCTCNCNYSCTCNCNY